MKNYWLDKHHNKYPDFPQDDDLSIMHGDLEYYHLEHYHRYQFVQNETLCKLKRWKLFIDIDKTSYKVERTPIVPGTLTGIIELNGKPIQTFVVSSSNSFQFQDLSESCFRVVRGSLKPEMGKLELIWSNWAPYHGHQVRVSYEYEPKW